MLPVITVFDLDRLVVDNALYAAYKEHHLGVSPGKQPLIPEACSRLHLTPLNKPCFPCSVTHYENGTTCSGRMHTRLFLQH